MAAVTVSNDELRTVRDAMRELNRMVDALTRGDIEKVVLTQRNQMRVVMVPLDRFVEMERCATTCADHGAAHDLAA
jgi:anthranilate/para-aminobenzoate synthase component I